MNSSLTIRVLCRWGYDNQHGEIVLMMDGADNMSIEVPHDKVVVNSCDFLRAIKTMASYQAQATNDD